MRCVPENSDRCISLRSIEPCGHSRDAGSRNCLLCRHTCLCNLLPFHRHHERWTFCHHPDHFLQTTAQGDQRTPADPPVDKRLPSNTPEPNRNEKLGNVCILNQWSYVLKFKSFPRSLQLDHRTHLIYQTWFGICADLSAGITVQKDARDL